MTIEEIIKMLDSHWGRELSIPDAKQIQALLRAGQEMRDTGDCQAWDAAVKGDE